MITKKLEQFLEEEIQKLGYEEKVRVIVSNRRELCDYQCDDCFRLAKIYHKNPMEIGESIVAAIKSSPRYTEYFKEVTFASPGFINMTLSDTFINQQIKCMMQEEKFGIEMPSKIDTYVLDYGGANIAKPLHVGHLRPAIVGESMKRIIAYMGHKTISDVHLGDYGLQIGQVIYGVLKDQKKIEEITLEYLEDIYPKMSNLCKEDGLVKTECANITKDLQDGKQEYQLLFQKIKEVSGKDCKRLYDYLGVSFDLWNGESDSYPYIPATTEALKDIIEESEGAKIIPVSEKTDAKELPPLIYQKSNGAYLYATTDLATIYERMEKYHPDYILYVADNRQALHFEQVFRACRKSGLTKDTKLEFLGLGTINGTDGKPFKTRSGTAPKLDSLFEQIKGIFLSQKEDNKDMEEVDIDKIVNAILKFADLQNNRERDYIFDISKFSNVVGKTGPYILYTYLRIQKILENMSFDSNISNHIYNEDDRKLRLHLLELEASLNSALKERLPSLLTDYIYTLSLLANTFYQNNRIQGLTDEVQKNDWLSLFNLTKIVLKEMLNLIIIDIPQFM